MKNTSKNSTNIYAICDKEMLVKNNFSIMNFIAKLQTLNIKILQYRNKSANLLEIEDDLKAIRKIWRGLIILNDYLKFPDLVDGYHLGQEDLLKFSSIKNIRDIIGDKILGISTHNKEEILEANNFNINYIGLGAYRKSSTKDVSNILGDEVDELAKLSKHDVAVIGGVKIDDKFNNIRYLAIGSALL